MVYRRVGDVRPLPASSDEDRCRTATAGDADEIVLNETIRLTTSNEDTIKVWISRL